MPSKRPSISALDTSGLGAAIAEMNGAMTARTRELHHPGHLVPNIDPVPAEDRLPPVARVRFLSWKEEADAAHAAFLPASDAAREANFEAQKARQEWARIQRRDHHIDFYAERFRDGDRVIEGIHPVRVANEERIARADAAAARAREIAAEREATFQRAKALATSCETWINATRNTIVDVESPATTKAMTLDRARAEISRLKTETRKALTAPLPSTDARSAIKAELDRLAERGRPDLSTVMETGQGIGWSKARFPVSVLGLLAVGDEGGHASIRGNAAATGPDTLATLAWLFRPALEKALLAEIDDLADDEGALSVEDREARVQAFDAELLAAERIECALVEAEGATYRDDTDPRALLGVEIDS
jgi:hypothetical protein